MKNFVLLIAIVLLIFLMPLKSPSVAPTPVRIGLDANILYSLIQQWRVDNGLNQYETDEGLCKIAELRVEQIKTDWSHTQFRDGWTWDYTKMARLGENLAEGGSLEADVVFYWLASPAHRENLTNPDFEYSCLKCSGDYCVQIFGSY